MLLLARSVLRRLGAQSLGSVPRLRLHLFSSALISSKTFSFTHESHLLKLYPVPPDAETQTSECSPLLSSCISSPVLLVKSLPGLFFIRSSHQHYATGIIENTQHCPHWCGSVGSASPCKPKGPPFDSRSGHVPRWRVLSLVSVHTRSQPIMFLSRIEVPLPLFLSL